MTTDEVIKILNHARAQELVAITQYMNHHYRVKGDTFAEAAEIFKNIALVEMRHAEKLADRITLLGGEPVASYSDVMKHMEVPIATPNEVNEMMMADLALERHAIELYTGNVAQLADVDPVSRRLFEELLSSEEEHADDFGAFLNETKAFELKEFKTYKKAA